LPVIAIAGTIGRDASVNFEHGIDAISTIVKGPCTLAEAIEQAPDLLAYAAERVMRLVRVGQQLAG